MGIRIRQNSAILLEEELSRPLCSATVGQLSRERDAVNALILKGYLAARSYRNAIIGRIIAINRYGLRCVNCCCRLIGGIPEGTPIAKSTTSALHTRSSGRSSGSNTTRAGKVNRIRTNDNAIVDTRSVKELNHRSASEASTR